MVIPQPSETRTLEWQDSWLRRMVARLTFPVFYLLNRPALHGFGRAAYDFALRCNGFAINFKGRQGLTVGEENFLRRHLAGRRGGVFMDIGANHGTHTIFLRSAVADATIHAFEPHPRSFVILQEQVAGPNIVLINQAVSDQPGEVTLYDFASNIGSTQASLSNEAVGLYTGAILSHTVSATTIDAYRGANGIERIDLLKIDTEGFDLNVLKGAARSLAAGRIGTIQFEFIPANIAMRTCMRDFLDLLAPTHVVGRICLNGELLPLAPYDVKRVEVYVTHNLIALPKSPFVNPQQIVSTQ